MYDHQTRTFRRRPTAYSVNLKAGARVRLWIQGNEYDLELEEALRFSNRIVDAAEIAEKRANHEA